MPSANPRLDTAWAALTEAARATPRIADLLRDEPGRMDYLTLDAAGLHLDLSKQAWDRKGFTAMIELARAADLETRRAALFAGEAVNTTEDRAALHMALRAPDGADFKAKGQPVSGAVEASRAAMKAFADQVRSGAITASDGGRFTAILHIGIGGSDIGPRLVWEALRPVNLAINLVFCANVDPADIAAATTRLDPARTLVVVVSKTFTTAETMANARAAKAWLEASLGQSATQHLVAISTALDETTAFGVAPDRVFGFWDWVGGRFSVWSAVGLSCAVALGWEAFAAFLSGAAAMDAHFTSQPLERNAPVLLALSHVYNRNGLGRAARTVVPYAQRLARFTAFLQQLEMESNGKPSDRRSTATAVFGEPGTNGQHAYFQLLHQGSDIIPVDFITAAHNTEGSADQQTMLLANVLAQAEALMLGSDAAEPYRVFPGDRPSNLILMEALTPAALGALIALYEHKTFVEGVIWQINSFDQWGVELGKVLAQTILAELQGGRAQAHDASTTALIQRLQRQS
jgi:glucose-6-phosphate isomerase